MGGSPERRPLARDLSTGCASRTAARNPFRGRKTLVRKTAAHVGDHERGARGSDDPPVVLADHRQVAEVDRRRVAQRDQG
jgi:hypothetical protein